MCSARKPIAGELRLVSAEDGEREAEIDAADLRTATPMVHDLASRRHHDVSVSPLDGAVAG
jgi:hypothetical protein